MVTLTRVFLYPWCATSVLVISSACSNTVADSAGCAATICTVIYATADCAVPACAVACCVVAACAGACCCAAGACYTAGACCAVGAYCVVGACCAAGADACYTPGADACCAYSNVLAGNMSGWRLICVLPLVVLPEWGMCCTNYLDPPPRCRVISSSGLVGGAAA